jgi:hypothetical protein
MKKENIEVDGVKYTIHELMATEEDEILDREDLTTPSLRLRARFQKCTNLSDEDYEKLTAKQRNQILEVVNRLNGWVDFQEPSTE